MDTTNYCQIVGKEIRKLREMKKLSVKELSKTSKVTKSTIYRLETGDYDFKLITLYKLCIGLKIKFTDFLEITDAEYDKQNL